MRKFIFLSFILLSMSAIAGDFFPPDYKRFPYKEGDLLISKRKEGKFAVNKILRVDRFEFKKGAIINIQGKQFTATDDDYLLVVSASYGADEFSSFEQARDAAIAGKWSIRLGHIPNRPPGAAAGQTYVGHTPVLKSELNGYEVWKAAFERGEAGVF